MAEEYENELIATLSDALAKIHDDQPEDYSEYIKKALSFIKENEESYRMVVSASEISIFESKLKAVFSKRLATMSFALGFSANEEKRAVQIYFLVSACVDVMVEYLKGNLTRDISVIGQVVTETVDKLKTAP